MPQMSGHEFFLALRAIDPQVRTILCSGFGLDGMVQEALDDGVLGFIAKPYRLDELARKLEEATAGPA
jgi:FixJ family two-component response regulator